MAMVMANLSLNISIYRMKVLGSNVNDSCLFGSYNNLVYFQGKRWHEVTFQKNYSLLKPVDDSYVSFTKEEIIMLYVYIKL